MHALTGGGSQTNATLPLLGLTTGGSASRRPPSTPDPWRNRTWLDLALQLFTADVDLRQVVVGQLAPLLLHAIPSHLILGLGLLFLLRVAFSCPPVTPYTVQLV